LTTSCATTACDEGPGGDHGLGEPRRRPDGEPHAGPRRDAAGDVDIVVAAPRSESPETGEGPASLVEHAGVTVRDRRARAWHR
jgi:hypothetical protein